jgi:hypothetical protein
MSFSFFVPRFGYRTKRQKTKDKNHKIKVRSRQFRIQSSRTADRRLSYIFNCFNEILLVWEGHWSFGFVVLSDISSDINHFRKYL